MVKITVNIESRSDVTVTLKNDQKFQPSFEKSATSQIGRSLRINFDKTATLLRRHRSAKNHGKYLKSQRRRTDVEKCPNILTDFTKIKRKFRQNCDVAATSHVGKRLRKI